MNIFVVAVALIAAGCGKKKTESASPPTGSAAPVVAAPAATPADAAAATPAAPASATPPAGDNLLSLASGVMTVAGPGGEEPTVREWAMLDEDPASGWACEEAKVFAQPVVLELPARSRIRTFVVDEAKCDLETMLHHAFDVEMSDESATTGFKKIAHLTPNRMQDGLTFQVTADVPGRWLRITALPRTDPDDSVGMIQIMNLKAYGERLGPIATPQVTGSYETDLGDINLTQKGLEVSGCGEKAIEPINGVLEGRVLRFQWKHDADNDHGPMVLIFGDNGRVFGAYWNETIEHPGLLAFDIKRTSTKPGECPKDKQDPIAKQLATEGRVRLYGINFDTDKDVLRPESKPTLDRVAALMKAAPDLRLRVEGHTDDRGTAEHNQTLSDARAASVKSYLVAAGVDAARLETQGFGATKPATSNASEMGRAANRRVELVKL